jgi:hypothetical protein
MKLTEGERRRILDDLAAERFRVITNYGQCSRREPPTKTRPAAKLDRCRGQRLAGCTFILVTK